MVVSYNVQILGFPCSQFGGLEYSDPADIKAFAQDRYNVTFPLMAPVRTLCCCILTIVPLNPTAVTAPRLLPLNYHTIICGQARNARFDDVRGIATAWLYSTADGSFRATMFSEPNQNLRCCLKLQPGETSRE